MNYLPSTSDSESSLDLAPVHMAQADNPVQQVQALVAIVCQLKMLGLWV
jgi:hypothetical protein